MLTDEEKTILAELRDELVAAREDLQERKNDLQKQADALNISLRENGQRIDALTLLIGEGEEGDAAAKGMPEKAKVAPSPAVPFKTLL